MKAAYNLSISVIALLCTMSSAYATGDNMSDMANMDHSSSNKITKNQHVEVEYFIRRNPGAIMEHCTGIEKNVLISYQSFSAHPVNFSVHFHQGSGLLFPVPQRLVTDTSGSFMADKTGAYCFVWENPTKKSNGWGVKLKYQSIITPPTTTN